MSSERDFLTTYTNKVSGWLYENSNTLGLLCLGGVLVAGGWVGYRFYDQSREESAYEAIYHAEAKLRKSEAKVREDRAQAMQKSLGKKESKPVDFAKEYAPLVQEIKAQLKAHSSTRAALVSALNLATFLTQEQQYEEALQALDIPSKVPPTSDVLGGIYRMHRGLVLIETKKTQEAMAVYQEILNSPRLKAFHPEALLKLGVAQELSGDLKQAQQTYERIDKEYPNSEASQSAKTHLRFLKLKGQQG